MDIQDDKVIIAIPLKEYDRLKKIEGYLICIKDLRSIPDNMDLVEILDGSTGR